MHILHRAVELFSRHVWGNFGAVRALEQRIVELDRLKAGP